MPSVLFYDPCCPKPYDDQIFNQGGNGGTELTVALLADGLSQRGWGVSVVQHNRVEANLGAVAYLPPSVSRGVPDHVVVLRNPMGLQQARAWYPKAELHLWCHDLMGRKEAASTIALLEETSPKYLVTVSEFHRAHVREAMRGIAFSGRTKIRAIYPPLPVGLTFNGVPYDRNQLCWLASPHKGLELGFQIFKKLHTKQPEMRLTCHNPGYFENYKDGIPDGVVIKPPGSYWDGISTLRHSLCLLATNTVFPETFGRIYAEANAVGTPCLTHPLGAAPEVLDSPTCELMDCTDQDAVVERILAWRERRPTVRMNKNFKLANVVHRWISLFNGCD